MATTLRRNDRLVATIGPFLSFFQGSFVKWGGDPSIANFAVGNPQEMPLPAYVDALHKALAPQDKDWFAYKMSEPNAQAAVARSLTARTGLDWDPADVAMTNGGFAALAVTMRAILEPGDEVIFLSPPWFFYELLIVAADGVPVRVRLEPPGLRSRRGRDRGRDHAPDPGGPREHARTTRPGGSTRSSSCGRWATCSPDGPQVATGRSFVVSDEPYNRIVFDGIDFHSPAEVYPNTIITYSYGKTLLAPGMRIGYVTVPPTMPDREALRSAILLSQLATGYAFPNALLQHAIEDLERLSIDIGALERRRDRLVPALRAMGYETTMPEGTFYVMARSPIPDDMAFADLLASHGALVLPGTIVEVPGWFRISLTASEEMVERGLRSFASAREAAGSA